MPPYRSEPHVRLRATPSTHHLSGSVEHLLCLSNSVACWATGWQLNGHLHALLVLGSA